MASLHKFLSCTILFTFLIALPIETDIAMFSFFKKKQTVIGTILEMGTKSIDSKAAGQEPKVFSTFSLDVEEAFIKKRKIPNFSDARFSGIPELAEQFNVGDKVKLTTSVSQPRLIKEMVKLN